VRGNPPRTFDFQSPAIDDITHGYRPGRRLVQNVLDVHSTTYDRATVWISGTRISAKPSGLRTWRNLENAVAFVLVAVLEVVRAADRIELMGIERVELTRVAQDVGSPRGSMSRSRCSHPA
jgi:hypothetical protein